MASLPSESGQARHAEVLGQVVALHQLAREAGWAYRFDRAITLLRDARRLLDSIGPDSPQAVVLRIRVLVSFGYAQAESGSHTDGFGRLDEAAAHLAEVPVSPRRAELEGLVLCYRGLLLHRAGRTLDGIELFDTAIERLTETDEVGDPDLLAALYLNRGYAYIELAQVVRAGEDFEQCIDLCFEHGIDLLADKARHNLGYVQYMMGDLPGALRHYAEVERSYQVSTPGLLPALRLDQARALLAAGLAVDAARHLDDVIPRLRAQRAGQDLAEAEVTSAAAALLDGRVAEARRLARSAMRRFTRRGNTRWAAVAALAALRTETALALSARRIPSRLPERAVKLAETLRALLLEDETGLALMLAVRMELRRGDPAAAELLLDQLPRQRATTPLDHRMLLRLCRAELAVARGDRRRALTEARGGFVELGRARDRMGGLELVCGTAIHGQQLGDLAVRLVLDGPRRDARRLFGWLERTRAQVYRYEPLPAIDDPVLSEQVSSLRSLRRAAQQARLAGRSPRQEEKQIAALEREILRQGWYASPWGRPRPVASLHGVSAALGSRALVTFAVSGDELVALVVSEGRVRLAHLSSATETFEWVKRLHADLDTIAPDDLPPPVSAVVGASARRSADTVDARLVEPLRSLVGDRELVIVPTGPLYAVPWGSLPSLRGRAVVVAPSATAWLTAVSAPDEPGHVVLARGPRLRDTIAEDAALTKLYPSATRLSPASVGDVLSALDGASMAHLAAHGEHEPTNAMFSRLELADGPLFAHELARLSHPPRHVVLAACELAMAHIRPGDEALGFAGGLLASGVRTVVAANSRVGDGAAAATMVEYHRRVAAGERPAVALAAAVAEDPLHRPFICLGAG
ncbi:CHAT domain-containing protein [Actinophytocola oryzae]|uniref:CHAT domain-containing protein n=1 Tax=Actinophytocola oryzae TaxID=502181 RepID=A0A4V3FU68_9PSEU|nr:CHAT domain-containing protein [Actinophytocola oryzae]TDV54081.1 CHAT domain-containing protein [Actinophytocola oryzae]